MSIFRDTSLGQLIRFLARPQLLQYPEERSDFQLPTSYARAIHAAQRRLGVPQDVTHQLSLSAEYAGVLSGKCQSEDQSICEQESPKAKTPGGLQEEVERNASEAEPIILPDGTIIVDWYGPSDTANPKNWTFKKKALTQAIVMLYTLAVYAGSSWCTPSYGGIIERFSVSQQAVSLTLSMYVLAYGLGPMLWSPLSEIPFIGRNPPYIISFIIFVVLLVPTALADNFPGLVVLRFLLGFFGSPCLATGGASMSDMYSFAKLPYALSLWSFSATSGPAIAPLISGFSVPVLGWRWSFWEMLLLSGPCCILMLLLLPETSSPTILLQRAQRLRALTGLENLKSQSEIDQAKMQVREVVIDSLWRPIQMMLLDPSVSFTALYSALIYAIYYSFFECFPLVYTDVYKFNLGERGLTFLSVLIGAFCGIVGYWIYVYGFVEPSVRSGDLGPPEQRLIPALPSSFFVPVGLFIFAWTSNADTPWIAPAIGSAVAIAGIVVILQCIFLYLPLSYPQYAASLFAGNDFARSTLAAVLIHVSQPMFHNLGVANGVTLLAGLTVGCIGGVFALWWYGDRLRARSRFAKT